MDSECILSRLRREPGIARAEIMPDALMEKIIGEESTVTAAMGSMPVVNTGLDECMRRDVRICVFEDAGAWHPRATSMRMLNGSGEVVGHDIPMDLRSDYERRGDVVFLSEDFVMYAGMDMGDSLRMEMLAVAYRGNGNWIPDEQSPVIWYPSSTSSEMIKEFFGHPKDSTATGILAFDIV